MSEETTFQRRIRERAEQKAREAAAQAEPEIPDSDDLVPQIEDRITDTDKDMSDLIGKIDILDAYSKFTGKAAPKVRSGQRESIKIFCPLHEDKNPSASVNLDKQTFACHHDNNSGGDIYTLGALHFGYDLNTYQKGENFPNLKRDILGAYGYSFVTVPGTKELYPIKEDESEEEKEPESPQLTGVPATVTPLFPQESTPLEPNWSIFRSPDWRTLFPEKTFMYSYMEETCTDDLPENYHLFYGLTALAQAAGRHALLPDQKDVQSNLYVCVIGRSGIGKTRAQDYMDRVIQEVLPYSPDGVNYGTKFIGQPGSGEVLVDMLMREIQVNPGYVEYHSQRALADYPELAGLVGRTARAGSVLKDYLIQAYDAPAQLSAHSRANKGAVAHHPFLSLITSTQPRIIRDLINQADIDSGFLTRVNFVWGQEKKQHAYSKHRVDLTHPVGYLASVHDWCVNEIHGKQHDLLLVTDDFGDELQALWEKQYEPMVKADETGILARLLLMFKKFILLMAINEKREIVTSEMIHRALPLLDYQIDCYNVAMQAIGETEESEMVARITEMIRDHEKNRKSAGGMTGREMQQRLKRRKNFSMKQLTDTLSQMEQLGLIQGVLPASGGKGRPAAKRYKIKVD